ncbi:Nickel-dependent lactate racemase [Microlunatus soli]|uniref:Nickel-dependent lactate racemase n=1 Tax=Microlunatus soli TaxID=630515 RepID=A0A1H1YNU4_9ACTN|nr:Nickel-dependent lactate racemase [Microlunatus soli]
MWLPYGRGKLQVDLPAAARPTVLSAPNASPIADPDDAVRRCLHEPVGSPGLPELAAGRKSACIVICDITRPVPNHLFLAPMIKILLDCGMPRSEITILVATGLHRPNLGAELAELIGDPWVLDNVEVVNHDARDVADLVDLGVTPTRGTPIHLNRRFVEADLRIVTGLVEPHFMAGWSGGRKVIAPGIAGHQTIRTFHSHRFMADPLATQCNLDGNPLHEDQLDIVRAVGEVYALNTVIDDERRLLDVFFGDVLQSHADAVTAAARTSTISAERRFRTVLTSSAGYPLDKTYYQTIKGMVTPLDILEPGGTLLIASECSEGLGSPEFVAAQRELIARGADAFLDHLSTKQMADIDEWQSQMLLRSQRMVRIQLYSTGLSAEQQKLTGVEVIDDLGQGISDSLRRSGDDSLAIIPDGPYLIPRLAPQEHQSHS